MRSALALIQDSTDVDLLDEYELARARKYFWYFHTAIHPTMLQGFFQYDVVANLQVFYEDFIAGKRPKLVLSSPPQHGKSTLMVDFIAWVAGKNPRLQTIFASYSDKLGERANSELQRIFDSDAYQRIFYGTQIPALANVTSEMRYKRNSELLEFVDNHPGSFRNTTVNGQITGFSLDLGVIDDPMKGRAEATSLANRDKTWNWLTDDFFSRFSDHAGMVMIGTRWHVDDPIGRWLARFGGDTKVLRYPAIAEHDEPHRKKGVPLFAEHKSLAFLMERRKLYTDAAWESLYQGAPYVVGGGAIPIEKLKVLATMINRRDVMHSVRYVDKAGSENEDSAFTACVLMHKMKDGTFVIEHVARGHWSALEREQKIKTLASVDSKVCASYELVIEQEPGSGGKESAENTIRNNAGLRVSADKVTGKKEIRAEPFVAQCQGDNVRLIAGEWVMHFLDECEVWPQSKRKDQVDAAAGAFNKLIAATAFDSSFSWVS